MFGFVFTAALAFKDVPGFFEADCKLEKKFVDGLAMTLGFAAVDAAAALSPLTDPGRFKRPSLAAVDSFVPGAADPEAIRFAGWAAEPSAGLGRLTPATRSTLVSANMGFAGFGEAAEVASLSFFFLLSAAAFSLILVMSAFISASPRLEYRVKILINPVFSINSLVRPVDNDRYYRNN
jgi:hypothetical protein